MFQFLYTVLFSGLLCGTFSAKRRQNIGSFINDLLCSDIEIKVGLSSLQLKTFVQLISPKENMYF